MRLEKRVKQEGKLKLILIPETREESKMIDEVLGNKVLDDDGFITEVEGEVRLSDSFGDHYITLSTKHSADNERVG